MGYTENFHEFYSHEIRNSVQSLSTVGYLLHHTDSIENTAELVDRLRGNIKKTSRLTNIMDTIYSLDHGSFDETRGSCEFIDLENEFPVQLMTENNTIQHSFRTVMRVMEGYMSLIDPKCSSTVMQLSSDDSCVRLEIFGNLIEPMIDISDSRYKYGFPEFGLAQRLVKYYNGTVVQEDRRMTIELRDNTLE